MNILRLMSWIVRAIAVAFILIAAVAYSQTPPRTLQLTLSWKDQSTDEDGFIVELRKADGAWTELTRTGANVQSYKPPPITGAVGTLWCYAVRSFKAGQNPPIASARIVSCYEVTAPAPAAPANDAITAEPAPEQRRK